MKNKTFKRIVYRGKVRFRICPRCGGTGTFNSGETCYYCHGSGSINDQLKNVLLKVESND